MIRRLIILGLLLTASTIVWAQQTIVFPAVSDEVEGRNGSLWVTVIRVVKVNPLDTVTVKRKWVCLPEGGFVDDPMPTWVELEPNPAGRLGLEWGYRFLPVDSSRVGAIALEVEGGRVIANSYVVDVSRGYHAPENYSAGQGQFIRAVEEPLLGPSHIPWLGGCRNSPCSTNTPSKWDFHRNNVGLVNPNPEPLTISGVVVPFSGGPSPEELNQETLETFSKVVPPYGWLQFQWVSDIRYGQDEYGFWNIPEGGFIISLTPARDDLSYYAYASVVFSPDPDSGNQVFNDPMFVPAEPGYVAPWAEVYPPKGEEE